MTQETRYLLAIQVLNEAAYDAIRAAKDTTTLPDVNRHLLRSVARITDDIVDAGADMAKTMVTLPYGAPDTLWRADWLPDHHMAEVNIWSGPSTEYIRAEDVKAAICAAVEKERELIAQALDKHANFMGENSYGDMVREMKRKTE